MISDVERDKIVEKVLRACMNNPDLHEVLVYALLRPQVSIEEVMEHINKL